MAEILKSKKIRSREIVLIEIDGTYLLLGKNVLWVAPERYYTLEEAELNFIILTEERGCKEYRAAKKSLNTLRMEKAQKRISRANERKLRRSKRNKE